MVTQGMTNIDCMTEELIREWGLIGNGYSSADLYSGKVAEKTKKCQFYRCRGETPMGLNMFPCLVTRVQRMTTNKYQ